MGVAGLLKRILANYADSHRAAREGEKYDNLFIDFNGLIYGAYGSIGRDFKGDIEKEIIKRTLEVTSYLITKLIQPQRICYIAVDGPAPRAKMVQQRDRRYKRILLDEIKERLRRQYPDDIQPSLWDTNKISPGTQFMDKLDKALKKAIKAGQFSKHSPDVVIHFNGSYVPGEAEHKYMKMVGEAPGRTCIASGDGDMLMLGARYPEHDIDILVGASGSEALKALYRDSDAQYVLVDLTAVNRGIHESLAPELPILPVLHDYVFYSMLGGNDFVRAFPFTHMRGPGAGDLLDRSYKRALEKRGGKQHLIRYTGERPQINIPFFIDFLEELAQVEEREMRAIQKRYQNSRPDPLRKEDRELSKGAQKMREYEHVPAFKRNSPFYKEYADDFKKINYFEPDWKKQYYEFFFEEAGAEAVRGYCLDWMQSLIFAINYYLDTLPSWITYYPHRIAPMPSDVRQTLMEVEDLDTLISFPLGAPFTPLQQQMLILPPQNDILPEPYRALMRTPILRQYYPETFELDFVAEGGKFIYAEPILPDIDADVVIQALQGVELANENRARNRLNTMGGGRKRVRRARK